MKRRVKWVFCFAALTLFLLLVAILGLDRGVDSVSNALYPRKYSNYVEYYSGKYNIDPLLLYAFIRTESGFDPDAHVESTDARGLMQITEIAFDWIKGNIAPTENLTFEDMYDPETNIRFGCYYVSYCLYRYSDDVSTAAAAYHSGWGTVDELLTQKEYSPDGEVLTEFPYDQMRKYVRKINDAYSEYQKIYNG